MAESSSHICFKIVLTFYARAHQSIILVSRKPDYSKIVDYNLQQHGNSTILVLENYNSIYPLKTVENSNHSLPVFIPA